MQISAIDQRPVWLLAGTGEGPMLTEAMQRHGWRVHVSVVTESAARSYIQLAPERLMTGALDGVKAADRILARAICNHGGYCCVVDATHPFAVVISQTLQQACNKIGQSIARFERPNEFLENCILLRSLVEVKSKIPKGARTLLALGARQLAEIIPLCQQVNAHIHARILPNVTALHLANLSGLSPSCTAIVHPIQGSLPPGALEKALCRRWQITHVICRQSGGVIEHLWHRICQEQGIQLLLLQRPMSTSKETVIFHNAQELLDHLTWLSSRV